MPTPRETLAQWLRDAHAMEEQAISIMRNQIDRLETYPDFRAALTRHLRETEQQRDQVKDCLRKLGEDSSVFKDTTTKILGNLQSWMLALTGDEVLKAALADYAFEHFEIASYRSLIAAAEFAGEPAIAQTCQAICAQEEAMAEWIKGNLDPLFRTYLARGADAEAKR